MTLIRRRVSRQGALRRAEGCLPDSYGNGEHHSTAILANRDFGRVSPLEYLRSIERPLNQQLETDS